jgi:hypothetical protein
VISNHLLAFISCLESRHEMSLSLNMVSTPQVSSGTQARQSMARNVFISEVEGAMNNYMTVLNGIAGRYGR